MKDSNVTHDTCGKCGEETKAIEHITGACPVLIEGDYTHRQNQVANIINQGLIIKCGL